MYGNFSKANMDTQTSSHMLLKNNSTEALNQILFPAREREIFEHLVFYYILLYCDKTLDPCRFSVRLHSKYSSREIFEHLVFYYILLYCAYYCTVPRKLKFESHANLTNEFMHL